MTRVHGQLIPWIHTTGSEPRRQSGGSLPASVSGGGGGVEWDSLPASVSGGGGGDWCGTVYPTPLYLWCTVGGFGFSTMVRM